MASVLLKPLYYLEKIFLLKSFPQKKNKAAESLKSVLSVL